MTKVINQIGGYNIVQVDGFAVYLGSQMLPCGFYNSVYAAAERIVKETTAHESVFPDGHPVVLSPRFEPHDYIIVSETRYILKKP